MESELLKSFVGRGGGQEVLCLTENLFPPDASLRRKLHHHSTSLCLMMLFCFFGFFCFFFNSPLCLRTTSEPLQCQLMLSNVEVERGLMSLSLYRNAY